MMALNLTRWSVMGEIPSRAQNLPSALTTLQAGRALAALAVAAFHLSITLGEPRYLGERVFEAFTHRGNLGVDFFFVLSGFIILHAHRRDIGVPGALGRYAWKRFARVFPIYWLYTAIFAALVALGFGTAATLPATAEGWLQTFTLIRTSAEATPSLIPSRLLRFGRSSDACARG